MVRVHPDIGERLAGDSFALGDFVRVMDRLMVDAASMDVDGFAEVLHRHGRALEVPAGESLAPGTFPFHVTLLVFW